MESFFYARGHRWYQHAGGGGSGGGISTPLQEFPCPPCPNIMDTRQQNCCGGNGAVSLKKQRISRIQVGWLLRRMWQWGQWQQSWYCSHIFPVRGDGVVRGTEIVMVWNCEVLCSVRMVCTLFFPHLRFLCRISTRSCRMKLGATECSWVMRRAVTLFSINQTIVYM